MTTAAANRALRRPAGGDPRVVAHWRAKLLTVPCHECLWWSCSLAAAGACRLCVGCLKPHDGLGELCITAHWIGYAALRYGINTPEVTPLPHHGCRNPQCQRVDPDYMRPWTHADTQRAASTQPRSEGGFDDVGAAAVHLGVQMLLFDELDDGPRPAGFEQGQAVP